MGATRKPCCAITCDWVLIVLLGVVYLLIKYLMEINAQCIPGALQQGLPEKYSCDDQLDTTPLLSFPYVKSKMLVYYPYLFGFFTWLFVVVVSLLIQLCCCTTGRPSKWDAKIIFWKIEALWREMLTSLIITQLFVLWIKMFVGRPRPLVYEYYPEDEKDAVQSFPSGHASSSFCIHSLLICHVLYAMYFAYVNGEKPIYKSIEVDNSHCLFGAKIWQILRLCLCFLCLFDVYFELIM